MRVKTFISAGLLLLLVLCAAPVYAIPALPHAFYGTVTINGETAPVGTEVSATGTGVLTSVTQNPVTTTVVGQYGNGGLYLLVQGNIVDGATITFYVNGVSTGQTAEWHSGDTTELNLTVTIAVPPEEEPSGVGGAAPPQPPVETNLFGITGSFEISDDGEVQETFTATSEDGMLTMTIVEGTIALDKDGEPLESLEASIDESPPDPPENCCIIALAFNFGPEGATFDPGITFEYTYDPAELPEGVAETDLVIAFYDADKKEWVTCDCTCDPEANCITACVCHFTTFAIIGIPPAAFTSSSLVISPAEVQPNEPVTITGTEDSYTAVLKINGVKEAEKMVAVAAGSSQSVSFTVAKNKAGSYSVVVDGLSGSFTVAALPAPPTPADFSLLNMSISPAEAQPNEPVTQLHSRPQDKRRKGS